MGLMLETDDDETCHTHATDAAADANAATFLVGFVFFVPGSVFLGDFIGFEKNRISPPPLSSVGDLPFSSFFFPHCWREEEKISTVDGLRKKTPYQVGYLVRRYR